MCVRVVVEGRAEQRRVRVCCNVVSGGVGGGECMCVCDVINLVLNFITRYFAL